MNGHGMQNNTTKFIALLNRLWDGKAFIAHRKTTSSFTVANFRSLLPEISKINNAALVVAA